MREPKPDVLKRKLDLDAIALPEPTRGVVLDWNAALVQGFLPDGTWKLLGDTTGAEGPGEATHEWVWGRGAARLTLGVFVSSDGPLLARQRLITLATENQRPDVPYVRGPADLGDVSTIDARPRGFAHLIWAHKHVCVAIKAEGAHGVDVTRIARDLQAHLAGRDDVRLDAAAPKIERVELSATRVQVNEKLTIQLRMQEADAGKPLLFKIGHRTGGLRFATSQGLTTTLSVEDPGPRTLTIIVVDESTLLSAWTTVSLEVTPAADAR